MATRRGVSSRVEKDVFMNCVIQVNIRKKGWQRAVSGILRGTEGVRSGRVGEDGIVAVSGFAKPDTLLKSLDKVGKRVQVLWLQYGECSSNLFGPDPQHFRAAGRPLLQAYDGGGGGGEAKGKVIRIPVPMCNEGNSCCSLM